MAVASRTPTRRARAAIALSIALVLLPAIPLADSMLSEHRGARVALDDVAARYARLLGLREAAPVIDTALDEAVAALAAHAYPVAYGADRAGTDLQQRIRRIAEEIGIGVVGSQTLAAIDAEGFRVVPVSATLDTDIGGLRDFLLALEDERPRILVDRLGIGSVSQRTGRQTHDLRVQIGLEVMELLP